MLEKWEPLQSQAGPLQPSQVEEQLVWLVGEELEGSYRMVEQEQPFSVVEEGQFLVVGGEQFLVAEEEQLLVVEVWVALAFLVLPQVLE